MRRLRQLDPQSVLFVSGENPSVYYHVSGLTILDGSDRPDFGFGPFRAHIESRLAAIPQFRWRLHEVPLGLDLPYWVEDEDFDLDHHVHRIGVPSPGGREELGELVAYLYTRHLDRRRPLWETWFIEGVEEGRYAVFTKVHHCMFDGQAAAKLLELISDFEPDAAPRPVEPSLANARPGEVPDRWQESFNSVRHMSEFPLRVSREVVDVVRSSVRVRRSEPEGRSERPPAPKTLFNRDITGQRGFVFGSIGLDDVKAVKNHFGVTVNDVVLALVGGSLRSYLLDRDALPDEPLRSSIAISLRTTDHDAFSNQVSTATVSLATDADDPVERLRAIAADADRAKRNVRAGAKGLLELLSVMPAPVVSALTSVLPTEVVWQIAHANVIVSSVRGSPFPLYLAGAHATAMFPMSIITTGGGMNVTCMGYADTIDIGITTEPRLVPDPWTIIDRIGDELEIYRALVPTGRTTEPQLAGASREER